MTPRIITYTAIAVGPEFDALPETMRAAAAMVPTGPGTHWMATGATPEEAAAKLQAMWEKERKSIEPRKAPPRKPKGSEDVGDVV